MNIQLINKQPLVFRIKETEYTFIKPSTLMKNFGQFIEGKIKGSTLGWNIEGGFVSYNQLKNIIYHGRETYF